MSAVDWIVVGAAWSLPFWLLTARVYWDSRIASGADEPEPRKEQP